MPSLVGETQFERHFRRPIRARAIASQKLSRDSGESIFAARHQGVSQGPLPKGPFRTKNDMVLETVVFYYCRSVLLSIRICCHFSPRKIVYHQTLHRSESL